MFFADAAVHWLHLMAAILWVGGTLATSLIIHPVLRSQVPEDARMAVYREMGKRFTKVQWWTWGILAGTGTLKLWSLRSTPDVFLGPFGKILAVKLTLVAAMAALSIVHGVVWGPALANKTVAPSARAALARKAAFWGKMNGLLMIAIVFCAALLRFNPF